MIRQLILLPASEECPASIIHRTDAAIHGLAEIIGAYPAAAINVALCLLQCQCPFTKLHITLSRISAQYISLRIPHIPGIVLCSTRSGIYLADAVAESIIGIPDLPGWQGSCRCPGDLCDLA